MEAYARYGPALRRKCERMLGSAPDAEDMVQGLFLDLLRRGEAEQELPYLYRAATNRCLNLLRDRKRRQALLQQQDRARLPRLPPFVPPICNSALESLGRLRGRRARVHLLFSVAVGR